MQVKALSLWDTMRKVLKYTDLVLFDLKHLNSEKHQKGTAVKNDRILENLKKTVEESNSRVWIRIPVIPGYNDSTEHMKQLSSLLKEMPVEKISLLNYHVWGKPKYGYLGKKYPLNNTDLKDEGDLDELKTILESGGLSITIGY